jgi:protein ImuB
VVARPGASAHLFDQPPTGEGASACLERLRARLGEGAVRALAWHADHRPECATREGEVAADLAHFSPSTAPRSKYPWGATGPAPRPLWLLPEPQALAERPDGPHWHGPLQLLTRSERLESGWWDAGEVGAAGDLQRDYFVARNPQGQRAWVFRDARGWFLHGLFA